MEKFRQKLLILKQEKKIELNDIIFYTLPGNLRKLNIPVTEALEKGAYNASIIIDYGDSSQLEMAELNFNYE